jgi:NADPH:quinone reductase-like Zn-dependent oxidoreductase
VTRRGGCRECLHGLAALAELVDRGELRVDVARRIPLSDLAALHAEAAAGTLRGKVVVVPDGE